MADKLPKPGLDWFNKAEEDGLSAKVIIEEGGAPSTACFLSQQVAEKCLKALLASRKKGFPKAHDPLALETIVLRVFPKVSILHRDLQLLNRYYIETRYPGDYSQFSLEECKEAYDAAKRVRDFVLENLN